MHLIEVADQRYTQSMTTRWTRLPRRSIPGIPKRRGPETTLLHKAAGTWKPRATTTKIQLIKHAAVDE
jgi:hypothetical protein